MKPAPLLLTAAAATSLTACDSPESFLGGSLVTVGIVGLGGLGHLAVTFAHAMGAAVTVFTTSPEKTQDACELGADDVVVTGSPDALAAQAGRFDLIVDTVSVQHDPSPYLRALRMGGTLCMLGLPERYEVDPLSLLGGRTLTVSGSAGTVRTQEMLDFSAEHGITADVEVLPAHQVDTAVERLARGDVRYRFVLDLSEV